MKHAIERTLVEKYCKNCENFGGILGDFFFGLVKIKCKTIGVRDDENCEACTGTLDYLAERYPPETVYYIARLLDSQRF